MIGGGGGKGTKTLPPPASNLPANRPPAHVHQEAQMIQRPVPDEVMKCLRVYDEALDVLAVTWHSPSCLTMSAMRPDHHAVRVRWNRSEDGRWTLIPLSIGKLQLGAKGW